MTTSPQKTIRWLGFAGLIPFAALALLMWRVDAGQQAVVARALAAYAATIVSFLGGVHWGIGFLQGDAAPDFHFAWGVVPALVAWLALMLPDLMALPLLAVVLMACYAVDRKSYPAAGLSRWLPMRLQLTGVASLSCLLGAAAL